MGQYSHSTCTIDSSFEFRPDITVDIRLWKPQSECFEADILWASPPCQGFSVAVIGKNWNHDHTPKTDSARLGLEILSRTTELIKELRPRWWFIENPRGKMRKIPFLIDFVQEQGGVRQTISYCQYGDTRMKPTDIWTNATWWTPPPICKNGDPCHEAAPPGSRTGTKGLHGAMERGVIPPALFEESIPAAAKRLSVKAVFPW